MDERQGHVSALLHLSASGWLLDQAASFISFKKQLSRCAQPEPRCAHRPAPVLSGFLPPKELVGRVIGRCAHRDPGCAHRKRCFLNEANSPLDLEATHPCFAQSGTYDGVGKRGLVRHSQPLLRPVHESHHPQPIYRSKDQTLTLPMVPHRTLRWPNTHRAYAILQKCTVTVPTCLMSH